MEPRPGNPDAVDPIVALSRKIVETCADTTSSMVAQVTTRLKVDAAFRKALLAPGQQNIINAAPEPGMFDHFEKMVREALKPILDEQKKEAALAMRTAASLFLLHAGHPDLADKVKAFEYPFPEVSSLPAST